MSSFSRHFPCGYKDLDESVKTNPPTWTSEKRKNGNFDVSQKANMLR